MKGILSIQSQVVFGHVGHGAAQFALQCLGHEVWAIPTVLFSNHPGHGGFAGEALPAQNLTALVDGMDRQGLLESAAALQSGYLGHADQVDVVAKALDKVRRNNAQALYLCDPVMGDRPAGTYVRPGIPEGIRDRLAPLADILTPNNFELEWLTGRTIDGPEAALSAARSLPARIVVVTSVPLPRSPDRIGTMAAGPETAWLCTTPRIDGVPPGTGDLFAALFLGHRLGGRTIPEALGRSASAVHALLTLHQSLPIPRLRELPLIQGRNVLCGQQGLGNFPVTVFPG